MSAILGCLSVMTNSICTMLNLRRISKNQIEEEYDNKKYVPSEILSQASENTTIQGDKPIITQEDDYQVKTHGCGCIFKTKIKGGFGYSNHWCDKHAPKHKWSNPSSTKEKGDVTDEL